MIWISDIFDIIAENLTQFDLLNVSLTCKDLNTIAIPLIYHSVKLDSNFSPFDNDYGDGIGLKATFIKSRAHFVLFINQCIQNYSKWGGLVRKIQIVNIPPEFYDFEMFLINQCSYGLFQCLNLDSFELNIPFGFKLLKQMILNETSRNNISNLKYTINTFSTGIGVDEIIESNYKFQNLNTLNLVNITNIDQCFKLLTLLNDNSINHLQHLSLSLQNKNLSLTDLSTSPRALQSYGTDLFMDLNKFQMLTKLSLKSIYIDLNDIREDHSFSFLSNLTFLELTDVIIVQNNSNPNPNSSHSFFNFIFNKIENISLTHLKLDIKYTPEDNTPHFLSTSLSQNQLRELDLVITYNSTLSTSLNDLIDKYIDSILSHSSSLEKLSIEIKCDKNVISYDNNQLNTDHIKKLINNNQIWINLKSLRLQTSFHIINGFKSQIFQNMPSLDKIWIMGSNSVPKHFGSGNTYPGIYDKWWRLIHLPKWFIEGIIDHHPLKYLKIDDCLFVIDHNEREVIQPNDSLDDFFYNMTKVVF